MVTTELAWGTVYHGSWSISFNRDELTQIIEFKRALLEDGVILSAL
jgi:hypothetical protein